MTNEECRMTNELLGGAGLAGAVDGEVGAGDFGALREVPEGGGVEIGGGMRVDDFSAGFAVEMDVLVEIGAVTRLAAIKLDLLDQAVACEVLQAVVNRGQRDVRGPAFHPVEDVIGRGMVRGAGENVKNLAPVRGEAGVRAQNGHPAFEAGGFGRCAWRGGWHGFL